MGFYWVLRFLVGLLGYFIGFYWLKEWMMGARVDGARTR